MKTHKNQFESINFISGEFGSESIFHYKVCLIQGLLCICLNPFIVSDSLLKPDPVSSEKDERGGD